VRVGERVGRVDRPDAGVVDDQVVVGGDAQVTITPGCAHGDGDVSGVDTRPGDVSAAAGGPGDDVVERVAEVSWTAVMCLT